MGSSSAASLNTSPEPSSEPSAVTPLGASAVRMDVWAWFSAAALMAAVTMCAWPLLDRPIWSDEAWMVVAAQEATPTDALGRMTRYRMPGALGYVTLLHASAQWFPGQIAPMRAISLVSAMVVLLIVGRWLGRLMQQPAVGMALAGTLLLSLTFQRYTTEIKQYMLAAALTLGMIEAMRCWLQSGSRRAAYAWFACALGGVLLAYASWFAIAGTGATAGVCLLWRRDWKQFRRLALCGGGVLAVAMVVHFLFNAYIAGGGVSMNLYLPGAIDKGKSLPTRWYLAGRTAFGVFWSHHPVERAIPLVLLVPIGWCLWLWRQPMSALLSLSIIVVTIAANAAGKWALWFRMNMPTMMILHVCLLAIPIVMVWCVFRFAGSKTESNDRPHFALPRWAAPAGFALAVLVVAFGVMRGRSNAYEPHRLDQLLQAVAQHAEPDDNVILDIGCVGNQPFVDAPIKGRTMLVPWPSEESLPMLRSFGARTLVTCSLHNHAGKEDMEQVREMVREHGTFELIAEAHMVGLYEFQPHARGATP